MVRAKLDPSVFGDFMQHGEINALFAIWNGTRPEDQETLDIVNAKLDTVKGDINDVGTMKKFWEHKYFFGNSCKECHIIYDRIYVYYNAMITAQKRSTSKKSTYLNEDAMKYSNMILLMLFFTRSTIHNHACPTCNISWKQYIINKRQSEKGSLLSHNYDNGYTIDAAKQLPTYLRITFDETKETETETNDSCWNKCCKRETAITESDVAWNAKEKDNEYESKKFQIPFILAECSDILSQVVGKKIMQSSKKIGEPLFKTTKIKEEEIKEEKEWQYIDDDGIMRSYEPRLQHAINKQYKQQLDEWQERKEKCAKEQRPMEYIHNFIKINIELDMGQKDEYQIVIDYNYEPPTYMQRNVIKQTQRTVKQFRKDSILDCVFEMKKWRNTCISNGKSKIPEVVDLYIKSKLDLDQNCIYILSNIIGYSSNSYRPYAILKEHYDWKHDQNKNIQKWEEEQKSYFDQIISLAKKLKLRHRYDTFLIAIERFHKKQSIERHNDGSGCIVFPISDIDSVLGVKNAEFKVDITVNKDDVYTLHSNLAEIDTSYEIDKIKCGLWLKIPTDKNEKQIDGWNDVLLRNIKIDFPEQSEQYSKKIKIKVNLSDNPSLSLWNPSLFDHRTDNLKFELKTNEEEDNRYKCDGIIRYGKIMLITDIEEDKKTVEEADKTFWEYYKPVYWLYQDEETSEFKQYDNYANKQIERDYKMKLEENKNANKPIIIPIIDGEWANKERNKNKYEIRIVRSANQHMYEINVENGKTVVVERRTDLNVKFEC